MSVGLAVLLVVLAILLGIAIRRGGQDIAPAFKRGIEQFAVLVPRMICALIAAGFIADILPSEPISRMLGDGAGIVAIPLAVLVGIIIPAGPVVTFSIAAVFSGAGASDAAVIAFITSWSIFAMHRIFIFEIPLLGLLFLRIRVMSAFALPFLAGFLAIVAR
ncbi:MAG: hypothetical protein COA47_12840 [Robiginitomaculum sp.]|nr:MAG: hypothetical protein COA47_12840 [Robiginitomaculum sp.]